MKNSIQELSNLDNSNNSFFRQSVIKIQDLITNFIINLFAYLVITLIILPFLILLLPEILKNIFKEKTLKNKNSKKIILLNDKEANFLPIEIYKEIPKNILNNEYLLKQKILNDQEFNNNKYNDIIVVDCIENINSQNGLKATEEKFKIKNIKNFLGCSYTADTLEIIQEVVTEIELDNGLKITKIEYKSKYQ